MSDIAVIQELFLNGSDELLSTLKALLNSPIATRAYRAFLEDEKLTAFSLRHAINASQPSTYQVLRRLQNLGLISKTKTVKIQPRGAWTDAYSVYTIQNPLLKTQGESDG